MSSSQYLAHILTANVMDGDDDEVDPQALNHLAEFVSSTEDWQAMDPLTPLARVVIGEADKLVLLARLVSQ